MGQESRPRRLILTAALAGWIVLWVVLGVASFVEVRALTSLSDTMAVAGQTLDEAGQGLGALASIPLVGAGVRPAAGRVQSLAAQTIQQASESRSHIHRLSILAIVIGAIVPIGLGIAVYVVLLRSGATPSHSVPSRPPAV